MSSDFYNTLYCVVRTIAHLQTCTLNSTHTLVTLVKEIKMRRGLFLATSQSGSAGVNNRLPIQTRSLWTTLILCLPLTWTLLWCSTFWWDHPDHWLSLSTPSLWGPHITAQPFLPLLRHLPLCPLLSSLANLLFDAPVFLFIPLSIHWSLLFYPFSISVWCHHCSSPLSCLSGFISFSTSALLHVISPLY